MPLPFQPPMSAQPGIGAAFASGLKPIMQQRKVANGLALQKRINDGIGASLNKTPSKLGTMEFTGLQPRTMEQRPSAPLAGSPKASMNPTPGGLGARPLPSISGAPPHGGLLPAGHGVLANPPALPLAPPPEEVDPNQAVNQFADSALGGTEFRINRRHPSRDRRAAAGKFAGLTPDQARVRVENDFRGLVPEQKQGYFNRGSALQYVPPGSTARKPVRRVVNPRALPDDEELP